MRRRDFSKMERKWVPWNNSKHVGVFVYEE